MVHSEYIDKRVSKNRFLFQMFYYCLDNKNGKSNCQVIKSKFKCNGSQINAHDGISTERTQFIFSKLHSGVMMITPQATRAEAVEDSYFQVGGRTRFVL